MPDFADAVYSCDNALRDHVRKKLTDFDFRCLAEERTELTRAAVALTLVSAGQGEEIRGLTSAEYPRQSAALVLTQRAARLNDHAGQWALPGGRMETGESPHETALRELREEVGLSLPPERVLGRLDDYPTRSGFLITPVVVWGGSEIKMTPNPAEVRSIHRIPVQEFMRTDAPILESIPSSRHPILYMPVGNDWIAAPTAAMLYQFREVAILGKNTRVAHFDQPMFAWR